MDFLPLICRCAAEGLRTLCLSFRDIPEDEYREWEKTWLEASTSMENRDGELCCVVLYCVESWRVVLIGLILSARCRK